MANNPQPKNPKEHLQQLNILFIALITGQAMIAFILFNFVLPVDGEDSMVMPSFDPIIIVGVMIFIFAVMASFFLYNKRKIEGGKLEGKLMEKLSHYRTSFIMRAALLEGANLVMIMFFFFVNRSMLFMIFFAIGFALFVAIRPSLDRIIQDYQLSGSEQNELRNSIL